MSFCPLLHRSLQSLSRSQNHLHQNPLFFLRRMSTLHALRRHSGHRPRSDPNAPRLPESTSTLVVPSLNLDDCLQSLISSGDLDSAFATTRQAVLSNTSPTVFTCNAIMSSMLCARRLDDVVSLFGLFQRSNIILNVDSYSILINTHCDAGRIDNALEVYQYILTRLAFSPSPVTYRHLIKGLTDSGRISEAVDLLQEMLNRGQGADSIVYNTVMDCFIKHDNMEKALELLDDLRGRSVIYDGIVHATVMNGYFKKGMKKEAMESYRELLDRQFKMNVVTCNALLEVLLRYEKAKDAQVMFDHMLTAHTPPSFLAMNSDSLNLIVNEYCRLMKFDEAIAVFRKTVTKPCVMDVGCLINIIRKLCENSGWVSEAEKLFDEVRGELVNPDGPDTAIYEFFFDAYLRDGRIDDMLRVFRRMVGKASWKPDVSFYNKVFAGLVEKDRNEAVIDALIEVYEKMRDGEVMPNRKTYSILADGHYWYILD